MRLRGNSQQRTIFGEIECFFRDFLPPSPRPMDICAAVSGGCDSIALFHLLLTKKDRLGIRRLGIAHVNHRLRGSESDEDARFVREIAQSTGAPFHEIMLGPRPAHSGLEEWARSERYAFFRRLCASEGYHYIATGHTADDQAETVLMRIMRGCGLKGLCAVSPIRGDGIIRPLLHIKKARLAAWLLETNTIFREDSSNQNMAYKRNRVRQLILPDIIALQHDAADVLAKIGNEAYNAWHALEEYIHTWIEANVVVQENHEVFVLRKSSISGSPFAEEALTQVLREYAIGFNQGHLEWLLRSVSRPRGIRLLPGGWSAVINNDEIKIIKNNIGQQLPKEQEVKPKRYGEIKIGSDSLFIAMEVRFASELISPEKCRPVPFDRNNMTVFLDEACINGPIEFRSLRPDDVFQPLGCLIPRNCRDYLKKRKKLHTTIGVVGIQNGGIIWVPGVQISHHARVTRHTKTILKFSCKHIQNVF